MDAMENRSTKKQKSVVVGVVIWIYMLLSTFGANYTIESGISYAAIFYTVLIAIVVIAYCNIILFMLNKMLFNKLRHEDGTLWSTPKCAIASFVLVALIDAITTAIVWLVANNQHYWYIVLMTLASTYILTSVYGYRMLRYNRAFLLLGNQEKDLGGGIR